MGLFDFFRKTTRNSRPSNSRFGNDSDLSASEKELLARISKINGSGRSLPDDLYQQLRDFETNWLERHYDFSSIVGINSIPVSRDTPGAPTPVSPVLGHTGEVYYYLRHKAYKYEEAGNTELALACMHKSVALVMCRRYFASEDCYPLVRMLARAGHVDEAYQQKAALDRKFGPPDQGDMVEYEYQKYLDYVTVKWLQENFPNKAPKNVTGYRRMKTQNTKNFQVLKQLAAELGKEI